MIFSTTMFTFAIVAIAKLFGLLNIPWAMVFSLIIIIPLVYSALVILALSSQELVEDPRKDFHDDR